MSNLLAAAQAALTAGRTAETAELLIQLINEDPAQNAQVYRALLVQLYKLGRPADGESWSARAMERYPRDFEILNTRGVFLRQLRRYPEALAVLEEACRLQPRNPASQVNRGNVLIDMNDPVRGEAAFAKLVRADPRNAEHQRQLGRALLKQGKLDQAMVRFRQAISLRKGYIEPWLDIIGALNENHRTEEANSWLEKAMAANPDNARLLEGRAMVLRRSGQVRKAEEYLLGLLPKHEDKAWLQYQLGTTVSDYDRERGNIHMRRAVELDPLNLDYRMALIESLERTRSGDEGAHIEESYQLLGGAMETSLPQFTPAHQKVASEVLIRVCAFDDLARLGSFRNLGRGWAESGRHTALLKQLARVRTPEDRLELVEQHRIWGRMVEGKAAEIGITRPPPRPADGKIRVGFMSSDLRRHPVAYFAQPLFEHYDPERFEIYAYSYYQGREDSLQALIAKKVTAFRWWQDISSRDAAQKIADDQLDILIELGGSTHMNKLEVMAYKPAPRQASWLGYPHSAGLATIDYFVCDPYALPLRPELLIETPLVMPHTWLALGATFSERHPLTDGLPEERNGFITYGTANNPHKYSREVLRTWAKVVAATPNSKFAFTRPEGSTATFRRNIEREFAAEGVDADRIIYHVTRGRHMPFYNEIDITLDPFPLTGGTTTTEALWMGVPVISLVGEAFYERLSYSILSNAGLGDLASPDIDRYIETALKLAGDRERRRRIRGTLRDELKASPLGQTEAFARDFYEMIARALAEAVPVRRAG